MERLIFVLFNSLIHLTLDDKYFYCSRFVLFYFTITHVETEAGRINVGNIKMGAACKSEDTRLSAVYANRKS